MAQSLDRSLGLHCLLYLVPDRICVPETAHPEGSVADALSASKHRLARVVGSAIKAFMWDPPKAPDDLRVFVPCRPTLAVLKGKLAPRLLMAALLECRDLGLVELRLAEERGWRGRLRTWDPGFIQVVPLATPALDGLCGQIMKQLERQEEQGAIKLLRRIGASTGERWVIDQVESELADRGYMRSTVVVRRWPAGRKVQAFVDCDQIQNLVQECSLAVDRWNHAWAADVSLYHALLADCIDALNPPTGG
jgi:hypothetical protein